MQLRELRRKIAMSFIRDCSAIATSTPATAAAQMTSIAAHMDLHTSKRFWSEREPWFVRSIANGSVVLDLGIACGSCLRLSVQRGSWRCVAEDMRSGFTAAREVGSDT